ncbi:stromal interaction molecule 1-like isoform X1 [Petromyzon marinus]|uniref:Stromal interaction molecule 1-like isoform X1 n=3 Tax=Petromyzon marinus TaxID=7757 RepID=A0AAJ7U6Q0_PETMA|nr:stromal interaction molecule 1-like isoform X1 [Petromyzon marinus]XP_032830747.1 stromal interaction molecule 1-like isoform X1 [Petromyzon marinus]
MDMREAALTCLLVLALGCAAKRSEDKCPLPGCNVDPATQLSFDAVSSIHARMDDDEDGTIDTRESDGFLREDMEYSDPATQHRRFHGGDQTITLKEMWAAWLASDVYNWTVQDVALWLETMVELPQYLENFLENNIDGPSLPRLAITNHTFMTTILKIPERSHRHKLQLKALDVVLFGAPLSAQRSRVKDVALAVAVVAAVTGCWLALVQRRRALEHVARVTSELDSLQKAEQSLLDMQARLLKAQEEQRQAEEEKQNLEMRLHQEATKRAQECSAQPADEHELRGQGEWSLGEWAVDERAVGEWVAGERVEYEPSVLQAWLQLTHEMEVVHHATARSHAERQLSVARDMAEKVQRKRSSVLGAFYIAHSASLDEVDHKILTAKQALYDVTNSLRERLHRWQEIERVCGFSIVQNPGLNALQVRLIEGRQGDDEIPASASMPVLSSRPSSSSLSLPSSQSANQLPSKSHVTRSVANDMAPAALRARFAHLPQSDWSRTVSHDPLPLAGHLHKPKVAFTAGYVRQGTSMESLGSISSAPLGCISQSPTGQVPSGPGHSPSGPEDSSESDTSGGGTSGSLRRGGANSPGSHAMRSSPTAAAVAAGAPVTKKSRASKITRIFKKASI